MKSNILRSGRSLLAYESGCAVSEGQLRQVARIDKFLSMHLQGQRI